MYYSVKILIWFNLAWHIVLGGERTLVPSQAVTPTEPQYRIILHHPTPLHTAWDLFFLIRPSLYTAVIYFLCLWQERKKYQVIWNCDKKYFNFSLYQSLIVIWILSRLKTRNNIYSINELPNPRRDEVIGFNVSKVILNERSSCFLGRVTLPSGSSNTQLLQNIYITANYLPFYHVKSIALINDI